MPISIIPLGWFRFFGTLIPVIGIIQVGNQAMLDRYAYVPSIGVFIMTVWGMPDLIRIPRHREASAYRALAMNGLAMASEKQNRYEEAMEQYLEAIRIYPGLVVANNNLGEVLTKQGRHGEAVFYFQQAARHSPTSAVVHQNLAKSLAALGMTDEGDDRLRPFFPLKGR